ncbi:MAG: SCO family protein [Bacteroidota bacterium]
MRQPTRNSFFFLLMISWGIIACNSQEVVEKPLPILGEKTITPEGDTLLYQIPPFAFVDQDSNMISEKDVAGKFYVADFFFTTCPSICPKMSAEMVRLHDEFLKEDQLLLLSYSLDPKYDTVAVLKDYATKLGVNTEKWHLLTGDEQELYDLAYAYMVNAVKDETAPGGVLHSGAFVLVDQNRHVRGFYDGTIPEEVDRLMVDIRRLIKEEGTIKEESTQG